MAKWATIAPEDRAAVVEATRQTPPAPFPTITVALADVKAWAKAQGVTWNPHDHIEWADAFLAAQYTPPVTASERKADR